MLPYIQRLLSYYFSMLKSIEWLAQLFSGKRGTTVPRNSWNSKDAKRQSIKRRERSTSCKGLRCSFTSPWNDVGVWHFKRDQRGSRISIHLHHSQLITGNLQLLLLIAFVAEVNIASIFINVRALLRAFNFLTFKLLKQLTICQNGPAAWTFPQMKPISFAKLRELRMTKLVILPEEGQFGRNSY